jgi:hypothetical protein
MTLINLTIAKTPTVGHVRCWNAKISKQDPMKANIFTCVITSGTTIALGDEIKFYDSGNVYTFGGYVQKPVENTGYISLEVADYGIQLSQITANDSLENKTPEEVIEYLINTYTDLTYVNNLTVTNTAISKLLIKDSYLIDMITNMLSLFNGAFTVDKNKNFNLYQSSDVLNSNSIINGVDALIGGWKTDNNKRAEKVVVKGATIKQRTTETVTGTGTEFVTTYTPDDVEILGLTQTTENITGDYVVDLINNKIIFNTSKTDPVISYAYDSVIRVELGTGKTVTLEKKYIKSKSEAIKLAREYKTRFEDGAQSSKWIKSDININNYNVGESISVTDTINNRTGIYTIKNISIEYPKKLTIEVGETEDDLFDWQKEAIDRIKQLEQKNENTKFITKYDYLQNKVKVSISIEITKLESYVDDGTLLWASETTLSSDADLISDDGLDADFALAYDDSAVPSSLYIDYL